MDSLKKLFKNPTNEYRGKPFWSWNGALEKDELLKQINVINEMGFGGFFMHSRTGLETEYLSEDWFQFINTCAEKGEELGLEAWLYDEDRWPSGTAGGMVTQDPKNRMKFLIMDIVKGNEFKWDKDYIAAFACELNGINYTECEQITENDQEKYLNKTVLAYYVKEMKSSSFYNGTTYVDTLNEDSINKFIELTHEKYKQHCGDKFGKSIKGIFTDEPHRGGLFTDFSGMGNNAAPWTNNLFEQFEKRFGYSLTEHLPELYLCKNGNSVSQVKWHFVELLQQLFLECFAIPINKWCVDNNIVFTGHVLHEDDFTAQTAAHGSIMRFYEHMAAPGVDVLTEGNKNYCIVKQLQSAARQTGKKWLVSELYGCTGWQFNFEGHKNVGDWQALLGINLRCHHLSCYTMKGESKRDYPGSIFHQSGWWREYKYVEDYFSRFNIINTVGTAECDLLVLNPIESVWCRVYSGCFNGLFTVDDEIQRLQNQYSDVLHWLLGAHIDFDYGDEEMVSRLGKVLKTDDGVILKVGESEYKQVLVAGMDTIRGSVLKLLKNFIDCGGKVVCAGDAPAYVDAAISNETKSLAEMTIQTEWSSEAISNACKSDIVIDIRSNKGEEIHEIFSQSRKDDENRYIMLLNVNREHGYNDISINLGIGNYVEEWDATTGDIKALKYIVKNGRVLIKTDIKAGGEKIYVVKPIKGELSLVKERKVVNTITMQQDYEYSLEELNVCVLDYAECSIENGSWEQPQEILKVDRFVRDTYNLPYRGGDMLQPWYSKKQSGGKFDFKGNIALKYEFFISTMPKEDVELVIECPEDFKVLINGNIFDTKKSIGPWIDICFTRFSLSTSFLKQGRNEVVLEAKFNQGMNLEALYILGNFGVELSGNDKYISELPKTLKIGDVSTQGLPFFSGRILYKVDANEISGKKALLKLNGFGGACVKAVKQDDSAMIAWSPYECDISNLVAVDGKFDIEVVLTRRNTFGPLHVVPVLVSGYSPATYTTDGADYSDNYMLIPQGLLGVPQIDIIEEQFSTC